MSKRVLLVEPYLDLARIMSEMLLDGGHEVDVAMTGYEMRVALKARTYACVLLNLDQNRALDYGLELAEEASLAGARIILIPDFLGDPKIIAANGWLQLKKPFTVEKLVDMVKRAIGPDGERTAVKAREEAHEREQSPRGN
jgi:DNA-binding NtrC family response regulator